MVCTADGFGLLRRMIPYNPTLLLCLAAAVEEGHDLRSCAESVRAEVHSVCAAGDAILCRPQNCVIVVIRCLDIHKVIERGVVVHEGGIDLRLAGRHHKGILGVALLGNRQFLAVLVGNGNGFQYIALIRGDGDGYGVTLLGTLRVDRSQAAIPHQIG